MRAAPAQHYAIGSLEEAKAYLDHPVLGNRLREWTEILLELEGTSAEQVFGYPDYLKFRSCMTLFSRVPGTPDLFQRSLDKVYDGKPDQASLRILGLSR
ncbi:MAG: DUF1810 domain-containing protein [Spirochaetaceae bacterium]